MSYPTPHMLLHDTHERVNRCKDMTLNADITCFRRILQHNLMQPRLVMLSSHLELFKTLMALLDDVPEVTLAVTRALKCAVLLFNGDYNVVSLLSCERNHLQKAFAIIVEMLAAMKEVDVTAAPVECAYSIVQNLLFENSHFATLM